MRFQVTSFITIFQPSRHVKFFFFSLHSVGFTMSQGQPVSVADLDVSQLADVRKQLEEVSKVVVCHFTDHPTITIRN